MALDQEIRSRDYLYGRLLAVAEQLESYALYVAGEKRATTAERYMQRFAEHPYATWRNIELALRSYQDRLRHSRGGFLKNRMDEIKQIMALFEREDYMRDDKLSGEFLLGYHCQKMHYQEKLDAKNAETEAEEITQEN